MKAAYFYEPGVVKVEEVPVPKAATGEIVIQVKAAAICGTDQRIYKFGHFKIREGDKRVLGHETAGVVTEVGGGVTAFKPGDRVAVPPNVGCGVCRMCQKGFNHLCPTYEAFGISYDGGFQEYMRIPASAVGNVIRIPDNLSFAAAAMVEPFSCTYNSWQALRTMPGDSVLIVGAGPIGACHVMINKLAGAVKIIVADVSARRLEEIRRFGADVVIDSSKEDLKEAVMRETGGEGADVVITACSVPEIQQVALEVAATRGRINFFGGMPKGKENVTLNTNLIHYKEMIALGTTGSSMDHYLESMRIAASGKIDIDGLATHTYPLTEIQAALDNALAGNGMKTLIVMEK